MLKKEYKVPFVYEMVGYIAVEAGSEEEAKEKASQELEKMSLQEMEDRASYLEYSEAIDEEGDILCHDPYSAKTPEQEQKHMETAVQIVRAWYIAMYNKLRCPDRGSELTYVLLASWAKEYQAVCKNSDDPAGFFDEFITKKFEGEYEVIEKPPYSKDTMNRMRVAMWITEAYMKAYLYGDEFILEPKAILDGSECTALFTAWAKAYEGEIKQKAVEKYAVRMLKEELADAIKPIRFTLEEYVVEDWRTRKEKVIETHNIEADTFSEAFAKAYPHERSLRYCSGHYIRIREPEYHKKYLTWKQTGLTIDMYYGSGVVD